MDAISELSVAFAIPVCTAVEVFGACYLNT